MTGRAPYFSVVTPSFNQAVWLKGCIESVLAQGTSDFEHIIFDNCSTDGTLEILQRYPHLTWKSEPDKGHTNAINKALQLARGEVICWLNTDDQYLPGTFEIVRRELSKPGIDVIFGDAQEIFFDGRPSGVRKARFHQREDMLIWWEKRVDLLQPSVFFKRAVIERVGPLREDLPILIDPELWWRISEHYQFHYVPVPLSVQQRQLESKTIKNVEGIYKDKARVFGPLLAEAYPGKRLQHWFARRRGMGRRWLGLAQSAGSTDPKASLRMMRFALRENPLLALAPRWWVALFCIVRRW